jgi:hypothetical protein
LSERTLRAENYSSIGQVWGWLVSRAVLQEGIDLRAVHWDTTSFYFEGVYEHSDLARYGYSPDQWCGVHPVTIPAISKACLPLHMARSSGMPETGEFIIMLSNIGITVWFLMASNRSVVSKTG